MVKQQKNRPAVSSDPVSVAAPTCHAARATAPHHPTASRAPPNERHRVAWQGWWRAKLTHHRVVRALFRPPAGRPWRRRRRCGWRGVDGVRRVRHLCRTHPWPGDAAAVNREDRVQPAAGAVRSLLSVGSPTARGAGRCGRRRTGCPAALATPQLLGHTHGVERGQPATDGTVGRDRDLTASGTGGTQLLKALRATSGAGTIVEREGCAAAGRGLDLPRFLRGGAARLWNVGAERRHPAPAARHRASPLPDDAAGGRAAAALAGRGGRDARRVREGTARRAGHVERERASRCCHRYRGKRCQRE